MMAAPRALPMPGRASSSSALAELISTSLVSPAVFLSAVFLEAVFLSAGLPACARGAVNRAIAVNNSRIRLTVFKMISPDRQLYHLALSRGVLMSCSNPHPPSNPRLPHLVPARSQLCGKSHEDTWNQP